MLRRNWVQRQVDDQVQAAKIDCLRLRYKLEVRESSRPDQVSQRNSTIMDSIIMDINIITICITTTIWPPGSLLKISTAEKTGQRQSLSSVMMAVRGTSIIITTTTTNGKRVMIL